MAGSSPNRWKTLWEKEKLLVMSNFSFSHSVFKILALQTCINQGLFGKVIVGQAHRVACKYIFDSGRTYSISTSGFFLTLFQTMPTFYDPLESGILKTFWEIEQMLGTSIFSFSHHVFYPFKRKLLYLSNTEIVICKCFQF